MNVIKVFQNIRKKNPNSVFNISEYILFVQANVIVYIVLFSYFPRILMDF